MACTHQLHTHGVAGLEWQLVENGVDLILKLCHTGRVFRQTLRVNHAIKLRGGLYGHDDVVAVAEYSDIFDGRF